MAGLREETRAETEYVRNKGYNVVELWECEWWRMKRTDSELQRFIATEVKSTLDKVKMSPEQMLNKVQ